MGILIKHYILCNDFETESSVVYFKQNTVWNKIEAPKDSIWNKYKNIF